MKIKITEKQTKLLTEHKDFSELYRKIIEKKFINNYPWIKEVNFINAIKSQYKDNILLSIIFELNPEFKDYFKNLDVGSYNNQLGGRLYAIQANFGNIKEGVDVYKFEKELQELFLNLGLNVSPTFTHIFYLLKDKQEESF